MSDDLKNSSQTPEGQKSPTAPVWIFALTLLLLFIGGVYFDRHSGWFDAQVYAPYQSSDELASYQPIAGAGAVLLEGKRTYEATCASCHGADGLGKPGQYPPLAGSEWVNASSFKRVEEIPQLGISGEIHVAGQDWNSQMLPMGAALSDADLAAVLTYIRHSWGNNGSEVDASDIKAMRALVAGHPALSGEAGLKAIKE
ncbi:MAG TPA: cytochrome c [Candidatus Sulfotelmatobacter sp.]|nr:cytochrome c [Candidatus Sulfotelmatobacter sp.]